MQWFMIMSAPIKHKWLEPFMLERRDMMVSVTLSKARIRDPTFLKVIVL